MPKHKIPIEDENKLEEKACPKEGQRKYSCRLENTVAKIWKKKENWQTMHEQ